MNHFCYWLRLFNFDFSLANYWFNQWFTHYDGLPF